MRREERRERREERGEERDERREERGEKREERRERRESLREKERVLRLPITQEPGSCDGASLFLPSHLHRRHTCNEYLIITCRERYAGCADTAKDFVLLTKSSD